MTIISLLVMLLVYFLDKATLRIYFTGSFLLLMPLGIIYDMKDYPDFVEFFEFGKPHLGVEYFLTYAFVAIGIMAGPIINNFSLHKSLKLKKTQIICSLNLIKTVYFLLAFLSLVGFFINMSNVIRSLDLLFKSPREYELLFGQSTFCNYLYFLNVPALCLSIYYAHYAAKPIKYSVPLNVFLVLISFFHGIKFTIFDTVLLPAIFFYIIKGGKIGAKKFFIVFSFLLGIYQVFSVFVRGGTGTFVLSILSYILPNFYNFIYLIERDFFAFDFLSPLFLPDKIPNPLENISHIAEAGFILNDKYNMYSGLIQLHNSFSIFGALLFMPFIYFMIKRFNSLSGNSLLNLFIATYLSYCYIFMFFFYPFTKTKYVYYLFVFIGVQLLSKICFSKNIKSEP